MKLSRILILVLLAAMATQNVDAQSRKSRKTTKNTPKPAAAAPSPGKILFENMLPNTQKVFVIDSIVVDKEEILSAIPNPKENGTLVPYNEFFNTSENAGQMVYVNGFGNKCFYSEPDTLGNQCLFTRDKVGNSWAKPQPLEGISNFSTDMSFPFMMSDGTTLYFAAKDKESVGGYDIFVTRYDAESGRYLKPENIGLPFNSAANDYLYIEDDLDRLAWFVTDRNQPEGKVCIYTFIPNQTRENYDLSDTPEPRMRKLAAISQISDTWPSEAERNQMLAKLHLLSERNQKSGNASETIRFVINDNVVYRSVSDFRSPANADKFRLLDQLYKQAEEDEQRLESLRDRYHYAAAPQRERMSAEVLAAERALEKLKNDIRQQEISIRNAENLLLTQ